MVTLYYRYDNILCLLLLFITHPDIYQKGNRIYSCHGILRDENNTQRSMNVKDIRRKNLRAIARSVGGVTQLAERLGKSQSQISHLIGTNPVKNIGDRFAAEVEKVFTKPHGWLDHEHHGIQEENALYQTGSNGRQNYSQVPLLNWQEAATWNDANSPVAKKISQYIISHLSVGPRSFALRVDGDSMEATSGTSFPNRSIIVIDPDERGNNGSYVLAKQNSNSQLVFKQLIIDGNRRYLKPLNPRYPITEITPQAVICGVARLMIMEIK